MAPTLAAQARNAAANAVAALCNMGTAVFETAGDNEVATCTFGATAFGNAAAGVATANAIADDATATGGVATNVVLVDSAAGDIMDTTATGAGGGGDFIMTSTTVGAGDTVSITSLTLTQPAS